MASRGQSTTALVSIAAAAFLVVLKLGTGIATGSLGLISAGVESSGDVVAAVLTFFAIRLRGGAGAPAPPARGRRGGRGAAVLRHPPRRAAGRPRPPVRAPPGGEPRRAGRGGDPHRRRRVR